MSRLDARPEVDDRVWHGLIAQVRKYLPTLSVFRLQNICQCRAGGALTYINGAGVPTAAGITTLACPGDGLITGFQVTATPYGFESLQVNSHTSCMQQSKAVAVNALQAHT